MLPIPYFIIIVIIILTLYAGITMKRQNEIIDKKIKSLWLNGYNNGYISNKLGVTVDRVKSVISRDIFYGN